MSGLDQRWNLNVHYHRVIVGAIPHDGARALDVGCGDGLLSFDLAEHGLNVIGIDVDQASVSRAVNDPRASDRTEFVCGDFFTHPFELGSFDLVAASAMLHHVDAASGVRRMKDLVRPGGVIALVGFAGPGTITDRGLAVAGALFTRFQQLRDVYWEHKAPVCWPPPMTTTEMSALVSRELPGSIFRRLMSNRYSLIWQAPT